MNQSRQKLFISHFILSVVCMAIISLSTTGCEPLRKKFRREKKNGKISRASDPILDPVDYMAARVSAQERYKYHYALWKSWEKELAQYYGNGNIELSDKRQQYILAQIIQNLNAMKSWLVIERAAELDLVLGKLDELQMEYEKTEAMRSRFQMKASLKRASRMVREKFSPKDMEEFFIKE